MTEIETLQKRVRDQRQELARLQKFHDDHQRGIRAPIGGFVEAEPLREAVKELISRKAKEQSKHELLSEEWWEVQHHINGLKNAFGQIDATIAGLQAKPKRKRKSKTKDESAFPKDQDHPVVALAGQGEQEER